MKRRKANSLILILLMLSFGARAQSFLGAFSLGTNLSQVDGDEVYGFKKFGLNASAGAIYPFNKNWQASVEIQFSQKGSYQKLPEIEDPTKKLPYYNLRLDYLEVPFLIHFVDRKGGISIGTGIQYGRLVDLKEVEWGIKTVTEPGQGVYNRDDWTAIVDIRIPLAQKFKLNFRYQYSMVPIRNREYSNLAGFTWDRDQYNNYMTLRLTYVFNEKSEKE